MCSTPVRNDNSVKSPFATQNIVKQILIVTSMLILVIVVAAHYSPCPAFLHSSSERRKIYFIECAVIHNRIRCVAVGFMIVECKMLDRCSNSNALHSFDVRHYHFRCEMRVFTHILEVLAIQRCTVDIYPGAEKDVFFAIACFFSQAFTIQK